MPFCQCGCGKRVTISGNKFLLGHNNKKGNQDSSSKNAHSHFKSGNTYGKGRPKGSKNKYTIAAENLFEEESGAIARRAVEMALNGHPQMIKMIIERIVPVKKSASIKLEGMPTISDVSSAGETTRGNMKKLLTGLTIVTFVFGMSSVSSADMFGGVEFPEGISSFADAVVSYSPTSGVDLSGGYGDATSALGAPDGSSVGDYVSLGDLGSIVLQFTDNSLTTSGTTSLDLWVFEIGVAIEPTLVDISTNGTSWINVGQTSGATSGIDIDAFLGSGVTLFEQYSYVRLTDLLPHQSNYPYTGADIDAVGAISSAPPVNNEVPEPTTMLLFGTGLVGLTGISRRKKKA